ncbi:hypothetical protein ABC653_07685 [Lacticaseibacillus paracasei]|uniref:hypothetical protein n=1 Tax=Lacticaseibacillus paracasei TaxID=1597 RepID=UPI0031DB1B0E
MYAGKKVTASEINFLDREKFVSFTHQADSSTDGVVKGVLPAGSIYPKNDATAVGVTINDVDVSEGSQPVGVIVEGYVNAARLPVKPSTNAITALKEIKFSHVSD